MKHKKKYYITPLYYIDVISICSEIKKKLFLRTYADIEKKIGCHNGYITRFTCRGSVLPNKWSLELIELYKLGELYEKKYNYFKPRKVKKTVNNTKGIISTKELLRRLKL